MTLNRMYGTCPKCGEGFFPLDEELRLLPGNLAPRQQEHLVHLACFMPFDKVAQMIEEILSCVWQIVWGAILPNKKGFRSIWTRLSFARGVDAVF